MHRFCLESYCVEPAQDGSNYCAAHQKHAPSDRPATAVIVETVFAEIRERVQREWEMIVCLEGDELRQRRAMLELLDRIFG